MAVDDLVSEGQVSSLVAAVGAEIRANKTGRTPRTISGRYYDLIGKDSAVASTTEAQAAGRCDLGLYIPSQTMTVDQIGVHVTTAAAASTVTVVIYSADEDGWPDTLLWSSADLDSTTTGYKSSSGLVTLDAGTMYWTGVLALGGAPTVRASPLSSTVCVGGVGTSATAVNYGSVVRRSGLSAAPASWAFAASQITNATSPACVRARAD